MAKRSSFLQSSFFPARIKERRHPASQALAPWLCVFLLILGIATPCAADWQAGLDAFKAGNLEEAKGHFMQVATEKPDWYGGHRMLGQVLLRLDRPEEALSSLQKALELSPSDAATRFDLGRAALDAGQPKLAAQTLAGPRPEGSPDKLWVQWLRFRAEASRQNGDLADARKDLQALLPMSPKDAKLRYLLASITDRMGDAKATRALLKASNELAPQNAGYLAKRLTFELRSSQDISDADLKIAACEAWVDKASELLKLEPSAAHLKLAGRIEACAHRTEAASKHLQQAIDAGSRDWDTAFLLARQLSRSGHLQQAAQTLEGTLASADPEQKIRTHEELGYTLQLLERYAEAIDHYSQAGAEERVAQAQEAQRIFEANLAEEERHRREVEIRKKIEELESESKLAANGEL